jgi:UbiD family decarboxylase
MALDDMREYLAVLEQQGLLRRVAEEVDPEWEIGCMAKWMFQALPEHERFGLLFDKVSGSDMKVATAALGASTRAYATALGVEPDEINAKWVDALCNPVAPRQVDDGPCQEVVSEGDDVDLARLPVPIWTPGKDAGRYITTNVVTRHAETGIQNYGVYRTLVLGRDRMVSNMSPGRQGYLCVKSHHERGEPAPVAFIIGAEPAVHLATVTNFPLGYDEMDAAGGIKQEAIEMVPAKTVDLMVPARTEIVVEGLIYPDEVASEGPFGEFAGYMGPVSDRPVIRVTAITHRHDPIFYGLVSQMPPSESTTIQGLTNAGQLLKVLRHDLGETGVVDANVDLTFGGLLAHVTVAVRTGPPGDGRRIGRLIADLTLFKRVTVVDHDIDIRDRQHMDWAMNSLYDPARDTIVIENVFVPMYMDPSVRVHGGEERPGSKIVVDATRTIDAGPFSIPSRDIMERALDTWHKAGLPEFDIPKRLEFRLDGA